ncbi:ABC transporter permease [Anaerosporobacter sp.]|uniref:ABC transporter permease n=1 Tax=Anaerosporobacter sp. TaxID=1872529 RepID=UPI00286F3FBB|nr:ABC transporter permease [Anaerosporobacter sp.]
MEKLLKLELRKIRKQKSFYVCTGVMVVLLFLSAITSKVLCNASTEFAAQYNGSGIVSMIGAISNSNFLLIAGIFVALSVCDDYEQQTIKNIYSKGYSKVQVYFSKFISAWGATSIMFVIALLSAFLFGNMYFGFGEINGYDFVGTLVVQYVTCMANISLYFAISAVLRKNGSSIAAVIVVPTLANMLFGLADSFLKLEDVSFTSLWLSSFMSDLSVMTVSHSRLLVSLIASLIYIPFFTITGSFLCKKIEL